VSEIETLAERWRPLGRALRDFHEGETGTSISVFSNLWAREDTPVAEFYRPESEVLPEIERRALSLCRGRVLDLGAGAGRHALELQRRGHDVTAIDVSADAVAVMRDRGVRDARQGDLDAVRGETFDTLLLLMHGIGLVGTLRGFRGFLDRARLALSERASILCDSADLDLVLPDLSDEVSRDFEPSDAYFGEVEFRLTYGELEGQPYPWLFIDHRTLERLAKRAGFCSTVVCRGSRGSYLARLNLSNDPCDGDSRI
jgi:SAM-dependent methyltransferase